VIFGKETGCQWANSTIIREEEKELKEKIENVQEKISNEEEKFANKEINCTILSLPQIQSWQRPKLTKADEFVMLPFRILSRFPFCTRRRQ